MEKKTIITYILGYIIISTFVNYYFNNKPAKKNDSNTVLRIENNKIITNKPTQIDLSLLAHKIEKEFTINHNQNKNEFVTLKNNSNIYTFCTDTGSLISYEYINPINNKSSLIYDYSDKKIIKPLTMVINQEIINDFNLDSFSEIENSITFYKKHKGYDIIRKYILSDKGINCEIIIDNPLNKNIGSIQIISEEQFIIKNDISKGAFSYSEDEKIINFLPGNELILEQSVILNPEIIGLQSEFFTQAIIQNNNSFNRGYFSKNKLNNNIIYYLESKIIDSTNSKLSFNWYIGPKIYKQLKHVDSKLALIMEYGIFSKISQLLMDFILLLTSLFNSLGLALLIFIIFTKLMVIPFRNFIKESNKKSKDFQQKMEYIKAKYHNEPDKISSEQTELIKKYGFLPGISGKIPQIANFFIFLSLQSVLRNNILLNEVPLGLWITNAALPDKYYVLSIIFIIFMYLNINSAKTTPMIKIAILLAIILLIYIFSFWPSSIQLFVVLGVVATYIENNYLLI